MKVLAPLLLTLCLPPAARGATQLMPLENGAGAARPLGMGSAFVAVADDASALLWNPAGLGTLKTTELGFHHNHSFMNAAQELVLLTFPTSKAGGYGFSFQRIGYGEFEGRDALGQLTAKYEASSLGGTLGWGKQWSTLSLGLNAKGYSQTLAVSNVSAFGGTLGLLWQPIPVLKLGLSHAQLLSSYTLRSGLSLNFTHATLALALAQEASAITRLQAGLETRLSILSARFGYQRNIPDPEWKGLSGLSGGFGLKIGFLQLDYAYLPFGELGFQQRASATLHFSPSEKKSPSPARKK